MLIRFEFSLYRFSDCRQFWVSTYPKSRPADGLAVYIKPAGHFILFDVKKTARSGDDRGQIDTGQLHPHSPLINLTGVFQGCSDEILLPKIRSSLASRIP